MALELLVWPAGDGEMARRIRAFDWSATPLGPSAGWPQSLRTVVDLMLDSAFPAYVWWGPDLIQFCNDPAIGINGTRHPGLLGTPVRAAWTELWGVIGELAEKVLATGRPERGDLLMVPDRGGPAQPAWFTFSYSALRTEDGTVGGIFITGIETTGRVRAEAALQTSEQQFEALLDQAPLGVYLVDSGLVIRKVNPVARPVFGDIPGGPVGRNFDEVISILWNKEYADELVGIFRQTLETGEPYVTPERAEVRSDRAIVEYYEWRVDRISLPGDEYGVVCYFRDISAQVHARHEIEKTREAVRANDKRQAFLLRLSDRLRPLADPLEVQSAALRVLGEHLGVNRAFFIEVDEERDAYVIHRTYANGVAPLAGHFRLSDVRRSAELAGSGQTVVVGDASADPRLQQVERASYAAMEVAAAIGVPLIKDGRWVAGLGVHHATPRHWTPEDIDLVREVAERTWAAVERAKAEGALRESEALLRTLFDSIDEGFVEIDVVMSAEGRAVDWRYITLNPAFERLTGMKDVTGLLVSEVMPDLEPEWAERFAQVVTTGEAIRLELPAAAIDRWFDIYITRIGGAGSRRIGMVYSNATDRKRSETALRESEARQAFLLKFTDALRPLGDPVKVQTAALRVMGEHLGAVRAQYWEVEPDGQHAHSDGGYVKEGPHLSGRLPLNDFGIHLVEALAAGLTVTVRDVTTDPLASKAVLAAYDAVGVRAFITVPLVKGGRLVALLTVHDADARDWTHQEIALIEEAAERTWAAVERAQAEAELREREHFHSRMLEVLPGVLYVFDLNENRAVFVNNTAKMTYSPDEIAAMGADVVQNLMHPDDQPGFQDHIARIQTLGPGETATFEYRMRGKAGEWRWYMATDTVFLRDDSGVVRQFIGVAPEITDRKLAEAALSENASQQMFLLRLSDALRLLADPDEIQFTAARLLGERLRVTRVFYFIVEPDGDSFDLRRDYVNGVPSVAGRFSISQFDSHLAENWRSGRTVHSQDVHAQDLPLDQRYSPEQLAAFDATQARAWLGVPLVKAGRLVAVMGISHAEPRAWTTSEIRLAEDVAERTWTAVVRAQAEAALRDSEARFAQFAASSTDLLWIRRADTMEMEYLSPAFATVYGMDPETALNGVQHWAALIVPEDRDGALEHLETVRRGAPSVHEFRIRRPSDSSFRWIRDHGFPLSDANGVKWIGGIATDVTEARLLGEHQSVLLAELQHRVRNIMAILRAVIARTAVTASGIADYEALMTGRLMALARTQTLLTRAANIGVDLGALVRDELEAQAHHKDQYVLSGPDVVISPKAAEVLSLAVHELATNALKYGALSGTDGQIEVIWQVVQPDGVPVLRLDWTERRPAPPDWSPPTRKGFGTQLVEQRVPYELRGRGEIEIRPEGCRAFVEFPLEPGASILETAAPMPRNVFGGSIDMASEPSLAGQTVLVLEDDFYLAQDAASALRSAGAEVIGPYATAADAIEAVKRVPATAAVLDVNLGAGPTFDVAHALRNAGTPFVFMTGYDPGAMPEQFAAVSRLQKPVEPRNIVRAVAALIAVG